MVRLEQDGHRVLNNVRPRDRVIRPAVESACTRQCASSRLSVFRSNSTVSCRTRGGLRRVGSCVVAADNCLERAMTRQNCCPTRRSAAPSASDRFGPGNLRRQVSVVGGVPARPAGGLLTAVRPVPDFASLNARNAQGSRRWATSPCGAARDQRTLVNWRIRVSQLIRCARLLRRVFEIDLEHCPNCGGGLLAIAAILELPVIAKNFTHLDLQARATLRAAAHGQTLRAAAPSPPKHQTGGDQGCGAAGA
jgi:hypothetical protein